MRVRYAVLLYALVTACGTLPLVTSPDGGSDDAAADNTAPDVLSDVAASDVPVDTQEESASDGFAAGALDADAYAEACGKSEDAKELDTADVDLDAATAPWAATFLPNVTSQFRASDTDTNGNIVLGGSTGNYNFQSFFLQTLDATGAAKWNVNPGSGGQSVANGVSFDSWGDVLVTGSVSNGTINLGQGPLGPGSFIAKYDAQGTLQWQYGAFANTFFQAVRAQTNGDVLVTGSLNGSDDYGGGLLTSNGGADVVLLQLSPCGGFIRSKIWGGYGEQIALALATDSKDDVLIGGFFENAIDFGGGTMTGPSTSGASNGFVAKLDPDAGYLHQIDLKSNRAAVSALTTDEAGNVFVGGDFGGTADIGGGTMTASAFSDALFAKLNSSLGFVWARHDDGTGSGDNLSVLGMTADPTGGLTVAGAYFSNDLDFGLGVLPAKNGAFVVRLDATGVATANYALAGAQYPPFYIRAANRSAWPDIIIAGDCLFGSVTLPSGTLSCGGSDTAFAARLEP